jgi:DICT domain-containing protein
MIALSYLIEGYAAEAGGDTTLVATFQGLSRYLRQLPRYRTLAPRLAQVYVIGVADVEPEPVPGVTVVPIDAASPLVQEWVVLASGPRFCAGLLAHDREPYTPGRPSYQFFGRWTTDPSVVDDRLAAFFQALGRPMPAPRHDSRAIFERSRELLQELKVRMQGL